MLIYYLLDEMEYYVFFHSIKPSRGTQAEDHIAHRSKASNLVGVLKLRIILRIDPRHHIYDYSSQGSMIMVKLAGNIGVGGCDANRIISTCTHDAAL